MNRTHEIVRLVALPLLSVLLAPAASGAFLEDCRAAAPKAPALGAACDCMAKGVDEGRADGAAIVKYMNTPAAQRKPADAATSAVVQACMRAAGTAGGAGGGGMAQAAQRINDAIATLQLRPEQMQPFQAALRDYTETRDKRFAQAVRKGLNPRAWEGFNRTLRSLGGDLKKDLAGVLDAAQMESMDGVLDVMGEAYVQTQRAALRGAAGGGRGGVGGGGGDG
jgi:hypothetical protein